MIDLTNLEKQKANLEIKIQEEENNINEQKQAYDNVIKDMLKKDFYKLLPYLVLFDLIFLVVDPLLLIALIIIEVLGVKVGMKVARENFSFSKTNYDDLLKKLKIEKNKIDELIMKNKQMKNLQEEQLKTLHNGETVNFQERKKEYNSQKLVLKRRKK